MTKFACCPTLNDRLLNAIKDYIRQVVAALYRVDHALHASSKEAGIQRRAAAEHFDAITRHPPKKSQLLIFSIDSLALHALYAAVSDKFSSIETKGTIPGYHRNALQSSSTILGDGESMGDCFIIMPWEPSSFVFAGTRGTHHVRFRKINVYLASFFSKKNKKIHAS